MGTNSAIYNGSAAAQLKSVENGINDVNSALNPFNPQTAQLPFYGTGARALLRIAGRGLAVATSVSWNISYSLEAINSLDSQFPWDITVNAMVFTAQVSQIIDPTGGPEVNSLFSTMASSAHTPLVEMQIIDGLTGTSILFARGIFGSISANVTKGQVSSWSATMQGTAFQHYVDQSFKPYAAVGAIGGLLSSATAALSGLTGGIL